MFFHFHRNRVFGGGKNIVNKPIYVLSALSFVHYFLVGMYLNIEMPMDLDHIHLASAWFIQCGRRLMLSFGHTPVVVYPFTGMYLSLLLPALLLAGRSFLLLVFLWCHTAAIMTVIMMQITEQMLTIIISIVREYSPRFSSPLYRSLIFTSGSVVGCWTEMRNGNWDKGKEATSFRVNNFTTIHHCYKQYWQY